MTETNRIQNQERLGPQPLLRDVLAELTFRPGRAIPFHVDSINLGIFHSEARQLANDCFLDAENKSSGKIIYATGQKKVLVPTSFSKSYHADKLILLVDLPATEKEFAEKQNLNEKYPAMLIHSFRNTNLPFSDAGLKYMMLEDSHIAAIVAVFIAGRTKNMLFLRGENAPQLTHEEAGKKIRFWKWQLSERLQRFTMPGIDDEEYFNITEKAERALLRQVCEKYDLKYFSGSTIGAIVTKQAP